MGKYFLLYPCITIMLVIFPPIHYIESAPITISLWNEVFLLVTFIVISGFQYSNIYTLIQFLLMFLKYISLNRNGNTLLKDLTWHNRCNANIITLPAPFKFKLSTLEWFLKQDNFRSFGGTLLHILGTQIQKHVAWWFNIWNDLIKNCQRKKVFQWIYAARFGAFRQAS